MRLSTLLIESLGVRGFFRYIKEFAKDMKQIQIISTMKFEFAKEYSFLQNLKAVFYAATSIEVVLKDMPKNKYGFYNHMTSELVINKNNMSSAADTIAHEFTHAVQYYLGYNFENYISYDKNKNNYNEYKMQLVEQEAFAMGQRWSVQSHSVQSYMRKQIKRGVAI